MSSTWEFEIVGGPDAGRMIRLCEGRRSLGRVPSGLVVDDPTIEPHHLVVEVGEGVRCVQLAGRAPVLVDGDRLVPSDVLRDGAVIRIGTSLLRLRRAGAGTANGDTACSEFGRGWAVTFGTGDVSAVPRPELPFDRQVAFDARCRRVGVPIVADLIHLGQLGLVGVHRRSVMRSIVSAVVAGSARPPGVVSLVAGLDSRDGRGVIVVCDVDDSEAAGVAMAGSPAGDGRVLIVLADDDGRLPPGCRALLTVGDTWRGTFVADVESGFDQVVRLHVAGCAEATARSRFAGSGRSDGAFVAQEISRPGAEFGRDVVGIPQTA